jgi:hypothetical protein
MPTLITDPKTVPVGIVNPNDLYNDSYNNFPNLRWNDLEFHDRIAWLCEQIPFKITEWGAPYAGPAGPGPGAKEHRGSTYFWAVLENGIGYAVDVLNIAVEPRSIHAILYKLQTGISAPHIVDYPGYAARNPPGGEDPVGEPWVNTDRHLTADKLLSAGRKIFQPSAVFSIEKWPLGTPDNPMQFARPDGRYTLSGEYIPNPNALWGRGGYWVYWWEKDRSR